jgi:hypothetical protein
MRELTNVTLYDHGGVNINWDLSILEFYQLMSALNDFATKDPGIQSLIERITPVAVGMLREKAKRSDTHPIEKKIIQGMVDAMGDKIQDAPKEYEIKPISPNLNPSTN